MTGAPPDNSFNRIRNSAPLIFDIDCSPVDSSVVLMATFSVKNEKPKAARLRESPLASCLFEGRQCLAPD